MTYKLRNALHSLQICFTCADAETKLKLETVSIAEPLQNRQHALETPNAGNTRRERVRGRVEGKEGRGGQLVRK